MPLNQLSRRTVIRGLGACVGLPYLEAMLPRALQASDAADQNDSAPPARSIFIHVNSGVANEAWYPREAGRGFQWSRTLAPLDPVREDVCVISGLGHSLQGHPSTLAYFTARDVRAPDVPINSVSIDQVMADTTEAHTRHPSLNLGSRSLSYNRSGTNLPTLTLTDAFEKLFVQDDATSRAQHRYLMSRKKSLLDSLRDQMKDLTHRLGHRDQKRLNEYLEAIRELEKDVAREEAWIDRPKPNIAEEDKPNTYYDLMYLALQTDSTRVITWYNNIGYSHDDTHHFGKAPRLTNLERRDLRHMEMMSEFLQRLKGTEDFGSNLLDHTMVMFGSSLNNGDGFENGRGSHYGDNLATILCGGRGLGIDSGQHLKI